MLNESTKANLRRKSAYVDSVQLRDGVPMWSWLDLSLTELCNRSKGHPRACPFCPRIDPTFYPNQNLHMSLSLVDKIALELSSLQYAGVVVLCGFGEPLLHPKITEVVALLKNDYNCKYRVEIVTNGDFLGVEKLQTLFLGGVDFFVVSMYDGPKQKDAFTKLFAEAGVPPEHYILRDRWHSEADSFGLKLTNRAGTVSVGKQDEVDIHKPCHYLTYQMTMDWNGDVMLCPQDWHKKLKFGNACEEHLWDIWTSKRMNKRRQQLIKGQRDEHPCSSCNTDGTLHGFNHVPEWSK